MDRPTTRQDLLAHRRRWRLVNERQREELRRETMEEKLRRLGALVSSALSLGWRDPDDDGERLVRERWRRLREALSG